MTDGTAGGDTERCRVCGGAVPGGCGKLDGNAPVYADGYVYHLGCEGDVFSDVYLSIDSGGERDA